MALKVIEPDKLYKAVAHETITVTNAVIKLSPAYLNSQTVYARIQFLANSCRVTYDGTDPVSATTGELFGAGDIIQIWGKSDLNNFKAIRDSADVKLEVTYVSKDEDL